MIASSSRSGTLSWSQISLTADVTGVLPIANGGTSAATALGAIWSSASPDFGVQGVLDRFGQIEPKFLVSADGYHYAGKTHSVLEKLAPFLPPMGPKWTKEAHLPGGDMPNYNAFRDEIFFENFSVAGDRVQRRA